MTTQLENQIEAASDDAPRVTPTDIEEKIQFEYFFVTEAREQGLHINEADSYVPSLAPVKSLMTFCVLQLTNGFTVIGESSCVSPASHDADIGKKVARQNAITKVWPLMGYALQEKLHEAVK